MCIAAERTVVSALDRNRFDVEEVHLGTDRERHAEAVKLGIKSFPALALGDQVFHINFGASLSDLK